MSDASRAASSSIPIILAAPAAVRLGVNAAAALMHCRRRMTIGQASAPPPPPNLFAPVLPLIVDWVADLEWKRNWKCHHRLIDQSLVRSPLFMTFLPFNSRVCLASSSLSKTERRYLLSQCPGWLVSESCCLTSSSTANHLGSIFVL